MLKLAGPFQRSQYAVLVGLPSVVFVVGLGWISVRVHRRLTEA
ncbi:MAG: hypothetical protein WCG47_13550 [Dermatophilaceae bacterium]